MGQTGTIAVIDVGSNSVRLLVARPLSTSAFEVVDEERFDARLGEGQADGDLTPAGMARGLAALRVMSSLAAAHQPAVTRVVGTEALRRAPNAPAFIARVREETGLAIDVLSGYDEAYVGFLGVMNSTTVRDGSLLDIGGGSLEFMRAGDRRLESVQSVPFGAIYSRERFLKSDPPTPREIRTLRKAVRQSIKPGKPSPLLVASGGAVRNLARIVRLRKRYPLRRLHGLELNSREVHRLAVGLARVSTEERRRVPGVGTNRAEFLHAAAIVIDEVMLMTGAQSLVVAGQGLREGLVWQEIRGDQPLLPDVRMASVSGLARANGVDEMAAEPVVLAAAALFEATRPVHGLADDALDLLLAAARLAGVGMHIDYYNRDRHAEYLVHSGDLHGFSHREVVLLAALVRWSGGGTPDLTAYREIIRPDDARTAAVVSALLGVARAIRRRTPSPIFEVNASLRKDLLTLSLHAGDGGCRTPPARTPAKATGGAAQGHHRGRRPASANPLSDPP